MIMTPAVYEEKRNSLLKLIYEIITTCTGLDVKTKQELENTLGKLKRNSFEIVLVGEFQGGKSTTFDTVCGGREISPRGIGIKTSACKISANSLPEDQEEYVDIRWKSDDELLQTMFDVIDRQLADNQQIRSKFVDRGKLIATLNDPEIVRIAKECIDKEWEIYEESTKSYDPKGEKLDMLMISTLILRFFDDPQLQKLREKERTKVEELQTMVTFPLDWTIRWAEGKQDTKFNLSEVVFAFLANAHCHIHCQNLERLGCTITDCPGLFAGPWDTEVARDAMRSADAILYLIGGQTAIKESDLKALGEILVTQQEHKLFFAINARDAEKKIQEQFRPHDAAAIRGRGMKLKSDEDIFIFHSRLAFNAKSFSSTSDQAKWKKEVGMDILAFQSLDPLDDTTREKISELSNNLELLARISGFNHLIEQIELSIVNRKFEAILVKGGIDKALGALNKLSGDLKSAENDAEKSSEECKREATEARTALNEFQTKVRELVDSKLGNSNRAKGLAYNFIDEVFMRNSDIMADRITEKIKELFKSSQTLCSLIFDIVKKKLNVVFNQEPAFDAEKTGLQQLLAQYVESAVTSVAVPAVEGWSSNVIGGNNLTFETSYTLELENIRSNVQTLWDRDYQGGRVLLQGLSLNVDDWKPSISGENVGIKGTGEGLNIQGEMIKVLGRRIATTIGAVVVGVITVLVVDMLIGAILLSLVGLVPGLILLIITGSFFGAGFKKWLDEKLDSGLDKTFRGPLQMKLRAYFSSEEAKKTLMTSANEVVQNIVESLKMACYNSLKKQTADFEDRVTQKEQRKAMAIEEQRKIAAHCKEIRKMQIDPAKIKISEFNLDLVPFFKK